MPSAYFSLEMSKNELSMRLLAAESRVFLDRMIKGEMETEDWQRIAVTLDRISKAVLLVDDSPNLTIEQKFTKSRRMKQQYDIQLIVIDYLQLLTSGSKSVESRQQKRCPIFRVRSSYWPRKSRFPSLPLPSSTAIRSAATIRSRWSPIFANRALWSRMRTLYYLIHRDDMLNQDSERVGLAEIIIGKQRSGPTGSVELAFQGHFAKFAETAH